MTRDFDSDIPLHSDWELAKETGSERVYEHSERYAHIALSMNDDIVEEARLYTQRDGEWVPTTKTLCRDYRPDGHKNEIVLTMERSFSYNKDDFPVRNPETESTDDIIVPEANDCVHIDNTESEQATFDSFDTDDSDITVAEADDAIVFSD